MNTDTTLYADLLARVTTLEAEREALHKLAQRGDRIAEGETPCTKCGGSGKYLYGTTATWRGGLGGARMTTDVCNQCWGSGELRNPWPAWERCTELARLNKHLQFSLRVLVDAIYDEKRLDEKPKQFMQAFERAKDALIMTKTP